MGTAETPWGTKAAAIEGQLTIDRNDFGLTYGPGVLGDEVTLDFSAELNPKQEEEVQAAEEE